MKQKHGESRTKLYRTFYSMRARCYTESNKSYKFYGRKGVSICPQWLNNFPAFKQWADANGYADNLTIDRIDPAGNYEPGNCRWITSSENIAHANAKYIEFDGEIKSIKQWANDPRCQVTYLTLKARISLGFNFEDAITKPSRQSNRKYIEFDGEIKTIKQWANDPRCLVPYHSLKGRIARGWNIGTALTKPSRYSKSY